MDGVTINLIVMSVLVVWGLYSIGKREYERRYPKGRDDEPAEK